MSPLSEFDLIDLFTRPAPRQGEGVMVGIGDDAAVLRPPRGEDLAMTVDAVVEGVHFDRSFSAPDIGWKALAVNLSDLAAMGARPLWALCALATPRGELRSRLAGIGRGLAACAAAHGVAVVGGNVTRATELSLTVTAVGAVPKGKALGRAGARPGDVLLVSGTLGDAGLGLRPGAAAPLRRRQRRPDPRLALGRAIAPLAHAAIDVSDGLLQDLGHLCRASGVGATVRLTQLPLSRDYRRAVEGTRDPLETALSGGEDYELLMAIPSRRARAARERAQALGAPLSPIGEVIRGTGVTVVDAAGRPYRPRQAGHDHLRVPGPRDPAARDASPRRRERTSPTNVRAHGEGRGGRRAHPDSEARRSGPAVLEHTRGGRRLDFASPST
jgi:thiamine-monophosphate kinase